MNIPIIRVFPRRTRMTPRDEMVFIGDPPLMRPKVREVHISVTFTWDIREGYRLQDAWSNYYPMVRIGGPAFNDRGNGFTPGIYLKKGVTITSRGCERHCPWCFVPRREGKIKLLDIKPGWIVQDNNLLMTPRNHQEKVYDMLRQQSKAASFPGGLDARLVNGWVVDQLRTLRIKEVYLAADTKYSLRTLAKAVELLSFLGRQKLRCYLMIGYGDETIAEAIERLESAWSIGVMPFAQLFQSPVEYMYSPEWRRLVRQWSRPAIMKAMYKITPESDLLMEKMI